MCKVYQALSYPVALFAKTMQIFVFEEHESRLVFKASSDHKAAGVTKLEPIGNEWKTSIIKQDASGLHGSC